MVLSTAMGRERLVPVPRASRGVRVAGMVSAGSGDSANALLSLTGCEAAGCSGSREGNEPTRLRPGTGGGVWLCYESAKGLGTATPTLGPLSLFIKWIKAPFYFSTRRWDGPFSLLRAFKATYYLITACSCDLFPEFSSNPFTSFRLSCHICRP